MTRRRLTIAIATSFGAWMALACSNTPIGAPVGDQNFDDPSDPGQTGQNNVAPEAGDANGRPCLSARDCPATFVCAYPIAAACGAAGVCLPYTPVAGCDSNLACACDGTTVNLCAPPGYATTPVASAGACDGGTDASTADAGADGSADAAAE